MQMCDWYIIIIIVWLQLTWKLENYEKKKQQQQNVEVIFNIDD